MSREDSAVKIKICGVREPETARLAAGNGANLLGLVFYPPSPRFLTPEAASRLSRAVDGLAGPRPGLVGLFVNSPVAEMARAAEQFRLDYLQLSGDETPAQVHAAAAVRPVIKTLRVPAEAGAEEALRQAALFGEMAGVLLLWDTHHSGLYGGTGQTGDWATARTVAARFPILLAGGLRPENVAKAVEQVRPWGVDVSSGVEAAPGVKDPAKIIKFFEALKIKVRQNDPDRA